MKPKKSHPDDIDRATKIANAVAFSVAFVKSPAERFTVRVDDEATARKIARSLNAAHGQFGRRACIYAITADNRQWPLFDQERMQRWPGT